MISAAPTSVCLLACLRVCVCVCVAAAVTATTTTTTTITAAGSGWARVQRGLLGGERGLECQDCVSYCFFSSLLHLKKLIHKLSTSCCLIEFNYKWLCVVDIWRIYRSAAIWSFALTYVFAQKKEGEKQKSFLRFLFCILRHTHSKLTC